MSQRSFHALGTASQVPTRARNHNGYFLRWDDEGFLFDPGEGTQRQMQFAGVAASDITKILITHFHGDHCLGLAGVLQRISLDSVDHAVEVYFPASGSEFFERLRNASIYYDAAAIVPKPIEADGPLFSSKSFALDAASLKHSVDCFGYRLQESDGVTFLPDKLEAHGVTGPAVGRLKTDGSVEVDGKTVMRDDVSQPRRGQVFAFVMDTRLCDAARSLARDADMLVAESTYLSEHSDEARSHGHMTASEAATLARDAGVDLLVLTHFSQRYGDDVDFASEARPIHENVVAVRDGDAVLFPKRRTPERAT